VAFGMPCRRSLGGMGASSRSKSAKSR
jgi:hypothetical protein